MISRRQNSMYVLLFEFLDVRLTILQQKADFVDKQVVAVSNSQIAPRTIQLRIAIARFTLLHDINELCNKKFYFIFILNVYNCSPNATTIDNWILNLAAKKIDITRAMIDNDAKIFLQTNGGHNGQAVCFVSYYNQASDAIEVIWLGLAYCGKASSLVAEGLKFSQDLWFGKDTIIAVTTGDSGAVIPESHSLACQATTRIIATSVSSDHSCTLHNFTSVFDQQFRE